MSDPQGPREEAADPERKPEPPQAGAQPPTESEPAPSAAPPPDNETAATQQQAPPSGGPAAPPPYGTPPGHYVFVPDGRRDRAFGPAFDRFARNRATHLVAAVVVGALIGGGTVAIFDNAVNHPGQRVEQFRPGGPGGGHRFPDFRFGQGGQGFGN